MFHAPPGDKFESWTKYDGWRPFLLGWRPSLLGARTLRSGLLALLLGTRSYQRGCWHRYERSDRTLQYGRRPSLVGWFQWDRSPPPPAPRGRHISQIPRHAGQRGREGSDLGGQGRSKRCFIGAPPEPKAFHPWAEVHLIYKA